MPLVKPKESFYSAHGKRWLDLVLILPSVIVIFPVLIIISLLVKGRMGSPVLFCQKRPGKNGVPFLMFKFRTMTDERDEEGNLLPDKQRLTKMGWFLRSASLDELPGLFNVLKGDLSLVGPRPLLMQYLERYSSEQARRHEVKPGITGWAQVNGRNAITWDEKFKLDVWYVDNQSFWLDMKIIVLTIMAVLKREGINEPGMATMSEFMGNHSH